MKLAAVAAVLSAAVLSPASASSQLRAGHAALAAEPSSTGEWPRGPTVEKDVKGYEVPGGNWSHEWRPDAYPEESRGKWHHPDFGTDAQAAAQTHAHAEPAAKSSAAPAGVAAAAAASGLV